MLVGHWENERMRHANGGKKGENTLLSLFCINNVTYKLSFPNQLYSYQLLFQQQQFSSLIFTQ